MAYPTNPIYKFVKESIDNRNVCVMKKKGEGTVYIPITKGAGGNTSYQKYLEWVAAGNTAEAAD